MRILFVAPRFHSNQHLWAKTLLQKGHAVEYLVLTTSESENYSALTPKVLPTLPVPYSVAIFIKLYERITRSKSRTNRYSYVKIKTLQDAFDTFSPDIVIVRDLSTWLSLETLFVAKLRKIPRVVYTQQPLEDKRKTFTRILQLLTLVPKTRITPTRKEPSHTYNESTHTTYIPFVVESSNRTPLHGTPPLINILFVGKFSLERKNHLLLLEALHTIRDIAPVHVTMVGSAPSNETSIISEIKSYLAERDMEDMVTLKSNIPHVEMIEEYKQNDLFVLPSVNEPFSISVLEAMSNGLPVIVSNSGGAQYCVENGINGFVTSKNSKEDLARALETLLKEPTLLASMGANALHHVRTDHSPEIFYKQFESVLLRMDK